MIECGTGSGSFSHSIARTIAPEGTLYSFEYHQERVDKAQTEFEDHGLSSVIKLEHRDVCKNGFGIEDKVTAIFLDLPSPYLNVNFLDGKLSNLLKLHLLKIESEEFARLAHALSKYN
jgi:tRNA A58 N-methylase Trm61